MKKFLSLLLAVILVGGTFAMTGCDTAQHELESQVKTDAYDYYETLKAKMENVEDESEFTSNLKEFCKEAGLDVKVDGGSVIVEKNATEGYEEAESNILYAEFDADDYKTGCQNAAIGITTIKNAQSHGDLRLIISYDENGQSSGVSKLDSKYFEGDNLINLTYGDSVDMINGSAKTKVYNMTNSISKESPAGTLAYKITISNLAQADSGDRSSKHTNPITFIADLLSDANSSGMNIEIASFQSNGSLTDYPTYAEAVVVIDKSSESKFERRLEKEKESFQDKNRKRDPDATFEFGVTAVPTKVLNYDDTSNLLCLLYTLEDGIFATTEEDYEGDTLGISTIATINVTNKKVEVNAIGRAIDETTEADMDINFQMTAQLSDYSFNKTERYPLWNPDDNNKLLTDGKLTKAFETNGVKLEEEYTFVENANAVIQGKNEKLNLISISVNIENATDCVMSLLNYMEAGAETK